MPDNDEEGAALSPDRDVHRGPRIRAPSNAQRPASSPFQRSEERVPRFQETEEPQASGSADETTRLLSGNSEQSTPRPSASQDRVGIDDRHASPGIRHRLGTWANPSPSPGRRPGSTSNTRRSVAVAASTGRDADDATHMFSLTGPSPIDTIAANQPYVDPGYAQLNPAYDQPTNSRPVWGLAKPLPRVIRPGMVPTTSELEQELSQKQGQEPADDDLEQGRIEPTLRFDKVTADLDIVRRERELELVEAYRGVSALRSRRPSVATQLFSPRNEAAIPEEDEEEPPLEQQFPQLSEAIAQVEEAKLASAPYEDAVPLKAYEASDDEVHNLHTYWSVIRLRFREPLAELLAITVQLTLGFSANLALTVSRGQAGVGDTADWAWGLATMIAIYIAGGISGAHLNPAMSLMLYVYRGFPISKIPSYVAAQLLGAFFATLIAFSIFQPGIIALGEADLARSGTVGNFITFARRAWVDGRTAFLTELTGTSILAVSVLALGDDANAPPGAGMNAFIIGLVIVVLSMAFGWNTGLAMNPARDFGPRLALWVLGYGGHELFADGYWFTVAWVGPMSGALLGGFLYDAAIFVGGESPVNYPPKRIRRATQKWRKRWGARLRRTKMKVKEVKDDVAYASLK